MAIQFRLLLIFFLVLGLAGMSAHPSAAQDDDRSTVSVSGEGTVTAQPDQATVRFAVVTQAKTAAEARTQNASAARSAMNAVRALDVPEEKMRMETLRLQPRREYNRETKTYEERGYEATRQVVVELDSLALLPQLVADVVEAGANRLDGVEYQLSDRTTVRNDALREAAEEAREKAQLLAQTLGVKIGSVRSIHEQNFNFARPSSRSVMVQMEAAAADAEPEAYAAGEIEVTAQVQVVFNLAADTNR